MTDSQSIPCPAPEDTPAPETAATMQSGVLRMAGRMTILGALLGTIALSSGCTLIDYKRVTYDLLRQEDCRRNNLPDFCARTFLFEYDEYERLRSEYLASQSSGDANRRVEIDPVTQNIVFK